MTTNGDAKWFFIKEDPNDRIRATARRHALGGASLPSESRLAREVIQNSVDATFRDKKTSVLVWNKRLSGKEVLTFRELIGFKDPNSPFGRLESLGLQVGNAYAQMKATGKSPSFSVTIIEDRNTCGLCYDEADGKDRFDELCLSYGQDATAAAAERGGSYGFGKGVYEEASDCDTFIVYSVYKPNPKSPSDPGSHARLFGCATFDGHTVGGTKYKGRALFGVYRRMPGQTTECRPVLDEDAHAMAQKLGFLRRKPTEYGTSIMILGSTIEMDALRAAVEDYWWPRIYANQLSVELWDDDEEVKPPEPREREDLEPYLKCYSLIEEKIEPDEDERMITLQAASGSTGRPGRLALKALPQSDEDSDDAAEADTYLDSTVALIRSGPKMVVEYLEPGGRSSANFVGVFVSHPDVDQELHLSEPPAHDSWSPNSRRLSEAYAEDPERMKAAQATVESILNRIKSRSRAFRRSLVPAEQPQVVAGARALQNLLARVMSTSRSGPSVPPPPPSANPFNLRINEGRKDSNGHSKVTASVEIELNDNAPQDTAEVIMAVEPYMVMDDDLKRDSSGFIELQSASVDGIQADIQDSCRILLTATKGKRVRVAVESEPYDRDQYAGLDVWVELKDGWPSDGE